VLPNPSPDARYAQNSLCCRTLHPTPYVPLMSDEEGEEVEGASRGVELGVVEGGGGAPRAAGSLQQDYGQTVSGGGRGQTVSGGGRGQTVSGGGRGQTVSRGGGDAAGGGLKRSAQAVDSQPNRPNSPTDCPFMGSIGDGFAETGGGGDGRLGTNTGGFAIGGGPSHRHAPRIL
jgi:hypothetical protein